MRKSASAEFPFKTDVENNCLQRAETIEDTLLSAIRVFLVTKRGSRIGNTIGCLVPELLLELVPVKTLPALSNQLKEELIVQFPGVDFIGVDISRDLSQGTVDLIIKISLTITGQEKIVGLEVRLPSKLDPSLIV